PAAYGSTDAVRPIAFFSGRSSDSAFVSEIPTATDGALGAKQFAISCAPCHGAGGFGGGPIAANLVERRPPSLRSAAIDTMAAGRIFSVLTDGFGRMPSYGWQMTPATRWAVVNYVRSLASQTPTAETRADSTQAATFHRLDSLRAGGASL